jgi:hypothetical protein
MAQVLAVLATVAAAAFTVVGLGVYLFVRFTQHRGPRPGGDPPRTS